MLGEGSSIMGDFCPDRGKADDEGRRRHDGKKKIMRISGCGNTEDWDRTSEPFLFWSNHFEHK